MLFASSPEDYSNKTRSELSRLLYRRKAALAKARLTLVKHEVLLSKVQAEDNGVYTPHIIRHAEYLITSDKSAIQERECDLALVKASFKKAQTTKNKKEKKSKQSPGGPQEPADQRLCE